MSQAEREYRITNLSGLTNREIAGLTLDFEQDYADLLDKPSSQVMKGLIMFFIWSSF